MQKGDLIAVQAGAPKAQDSANRPRVNVVLNWTEELKRLVPAE
jgi:hypothetical protein